MKSLSIRNLSKTYFDLYAGTQVTAVHDVSLNVPEGEFVSIVGPSGCGKSTILNMIAGFIPITGGEILLGGQPVKGPGPDRGVVFQLFALFPWRTVLENVAFGPKMRGFPKAEREKIAHDYLALAKLTEAAGRYPNELSGGMQQRVGVVRALANEPDVLLMDEPFASVDAQTRMTLQEELTRIWQDKKPTVIFITHDVARGRLPCQPRGRALQGPRAGRDCGRPAPPAIMGRATRGRAFKALTSARTTTRALGLSSHVARRRNGRLPARRTCLACASSVDHRGVLTWRGRCGSVVAASGKIAACFQTGARRSTYS